ncbi:MAG: HlyC/CorC family transporter [Flavobacteriaceae bacterium]|nr:HlyC/CorC family transporter [Flavobacteriaceae bacterium]
MTNHIFIILSSILLSAFFSGMEIALVSSNRLQVALERKKEGIKAKLLNILTKNSSRFITTMLIGNNIALVTYGYYMGILFKNLVSPYGFNDFSLLVIQTIVSTLVILITAEFLPKAIFRIYSNYLLEFFVVPAYLFYILFYLISTFITFISDSILYVFFKSKKNYDNNNFSKEELDSYISEQIEFTENTEQIDSEVHIFQKALHFHKVKVREIMVPRTDLEAIDIKESINTLKKLFVSSGYSKIIIFRNTLDDIIGFVHMSDLYKKPNKIINILRPIEYMPEAMKAEDSMNLLVKKRIGLGVVLDEYGGTSGIVTVEDIIEELFGEIEDEHDRNILLDEKISDNSYKFSTRLEIDYINGTYELDIPKEESYETLGGFILDNIGYIPVKDEEVLIGDFRIKILKVSSSKIEQVLMIKK